MTTTHPTTTAPDAERAGHVDDVLAAVRGLDGFFREHAESNEAAGGVAPEVFAELLALKIPFAFAPRSLGGLQLSAAEATRVFEQIAYSDASTGWVAFVTASATGMAAGYLPDSAVERVFDPRGPQVIAGAGAPTGLAVRTDGGYLLSGRWSYGSGLVHADLVHSGALIAVDGRPVLDEHGHPEVVVLHARKQDVSPAGNWDTLGLRASGSVDYVAKDAFVPDDLVFPLAGAVPRRREELFGMGVINLNAIGHAAWAAGVGRRMLDELAAYARDKAGKPGALADSESFWEKLGLVEGHFRAAHALLYDVWEHVDATLAAGGDLTTEDTTSVRLALYMITAAAAEAADLAYLAGGGTSLRSGTLQRLYRDIHTGTQHVTVSPKVLQNCGRQSAGLSGTKSWFLYDLVDTA